MPGGVGGARSFGRPLSRLGQMPSHHNVPVSSNVRPHNHTIMHTLYKNYYSQASYQNTFLVNHPNEIARAEASNKEWNNIKDSGCHLTCLAMIAGIDPAAFAAALTARGKTTSSYFSADSSLPAKNLGGIDCGLVWDQNKPTEPGSSIRTTPVWHHKTRRKVKIVITCIDTYKPRSLAASIEIVVEAIARGNHIVCGPESHSVLVAGFGENGPFIWDPDPHSESFDSMIAGNLALTDYASSLGKGRLFIHEYACSAA